jgi:hypothetical protein
MAKFTEILKSINEMSPYYNNNGLTITNPVTKISLEHLENTWTFQKDFGNDIFFYQRNDKLAFAVGIKNSDKFIVYTIVFCSKPRTGTPKHKNAIQVEMVHANETWKNSGFTKSMYEEIANNFILISDSEQYGLSKDLWKSLASKHQQMTFGLEATADVTATYQLNGASSHVKLKAPNGEVEFTLPASGLHNVKNALAASTIAYFLKIPCDVVLSGIQHYSGFENRFETRSIKELHFSTQNGILQTANKATNGFADRITMYKNDDGKIWYEQFGGRIVTSTPVRYIIPGNPANGSMHMSYTDTQDAQYWMDKLNTDGEKKVGEEMLAELRKLLRPSIPPPRFVKAHAWAHGVTYWLPGNYSPKELSNGALTPFPKELPAVHVCGESFSLRQGWMEGAVEHAAALLKKIGKK